MAVIPVAPTVPVGPASTTGTVGPTSTTMQPLDVAADPYQYPSGRVAPAEAPAASPMSSLGDLSSRVVSANKGYAKGGKIKGYAKGGSVSSASKRGDGCAIRGKTKGRFV